MTSTSRLLRLGLGCLLAGLAPLLSAAPLITEFVAGNTEGIVDEDGEHSDWIELHNPDGAPVSLLGWALTDNATVPQKWFFPDVTLEPGAFLIVWADGKNRRAPGEPLHTNFALSAGGEYLALVDADGMVAQDFGPEFPSQDDDRSFGLSFQGTPLVSAGASARILVPANGGLGTTWTEEAFTPSGWMTGPTGVGFGVLEQGLTVRVVKKNTAFGTLGTLALTDQLLAFPPGSPQIQQEYSQMLPTLNLLGEGAGGNFGGDDPVTLGDPNVYAVQATGYLNIVTAGTYTFGVNSDDGGRIRINGANVMVDDTNHGPTDHFGTVTLGVGLHPFEVVMWEEGGGDEVEFFAAPGTLTVFNSTFRLVGDTAGGGIEVLTEPGGGGGGAGGPVQTDLEAAMRNVRASAYLRVPFTAPDPETFDTITLGLRYADGFIAYLNGMEVARSNAPAAAAFNSAATATRSPAEALAVANFNVTAAKGVLHAGTNVLALHGLNNAVSDGTFLVLPEVIGGGFNPGQPYYFNEPTPGGPNSAPSSLGKVADTVFSVKRGLYPNAEVTAVPFPVEISCATPEATIRYTTDGTEPSETNGTTYSGPVTISGTTVLRAMAYRANWDPTNIDTQTYVVLDDILTQSADGSPPPGWPVGPVNGQVFDYGMDPDIVNHVNPALGGPAQVKAALEAIPTMCLTIAPEDFHNASNGIYSHPNNRGYGWERAASLELFNHPEGEFGERCGVRIRGGFSRSGDNPKHSFHIYFRSEWGKSKLDFSLFGEEGAAEHDVIDLRTAQNYSWSFQGDAGNNTFLREEFTRVSQGAMGQPYSRTFYFHLYINGQYWGLFDIDERPEAGFAAEYLGGSKDDYDVVKSAGAPGGYTTELAQGTFDLWQDLWNQALAHASAPANEANARYFRMQGLAPDGVTPLDPATDPALLDVDNQIDFLLLVFHMGSSDAPLTGGGDRVNNWFTFRSRAQNRGFVHVAHDMEHSNFSGTDRTGPYANASITDFNYSNPQYIHQHLLGNLEYRTRFGDRVQKHLFNGGALSTEANLARMNALAAVVDSAIIAESARWGDAKSAVPRTRADWLNARNFLTNNYLPNRNNDVLNQLKADGLYPASLQGVAFNPFGGYVSHVTQIALTSNGRIFYTLDGTDPRLIGGAVNTASALEFLGGTTSTETLVDWGADAPGATWKYRDPSVDLGSSDIVLGHPGYNASHWKHPAFDDSGAEWASGDAQLGAGDAQRTTINVGPASERYPVVYFRKKFTVTDPGQFSSLSLEIVRDDGAIIYLNGREVGRSNAPGGTVGYEYFPSNGVGGTDEETFFTVTDPRLSPSALVEGENTICVEMHQTNAGSSDLGFDLRLRGVRSVFPEPIFLDGPAVVEMKARSYDGANWGALTETQFVVDAEAPNLNNLVLSEIMYHPADATLDEIALGFDGSNDFEFLELQNIGPLAIDLSRLRFIAGIAFDFSTSMADRLLLSGERVLIVGKADAFAHRYGSTPVAGEFSGTLDNAGETLTLADIEPGVLKSFTYGTSGEWPRDADGPGYSLVLLEPGLNPDPGQASSWRTSALPGGNPGTSDALTFPEWKTLHALADDLGDDDHDGLNNLAEYGLGTLPTSANAAPLALGLEEILGETFVTLTFTRRLGADDCAFFPEAGAGLEDWDSAAMEIVDRFPNGDGTETVVARTVSAAPAASDVFVRVRFAVP